ncbi:MAG: hypothetical protein AB8B63_22410 [Granulosicoccus sp.]
MNWNIDRCTCWMQQKDKQIHWCYPVEGQEFPDPANYAGVVVFGGANSANDCSEHDWVKRELEFVEQCLKSDVGFFGICLGAQMLARTLGAQVRPHEQQIKEIGFSRVDPVSEAPQFLQTPLMIMQWHSEGFELPASTRLIATGEDFPNQAYQMNDRVLGLQFHPEVNPEVLAIWHERNKTMPSGVLTEEERVSMMADAHRYDASITGWLDGIFTDWTHKCETFA